MAEPRRRNLPGTPQGEIFKWKSSDFKADGHYSVQEWIQDKIRSDPTDIKAICKPPEHVHKHEWIYEHIRQIIIELNALVVSLQASCTGSSCPKMTAGEGFEFLSACYGAQPQMVSAVDYACHNIDFHVAIINKTKNFPRPKLFDQHKPPTCPPHTFAFMHTFDHVSLCQP
eukprot:1370422-Amorphochlora_amoeboformis.AAC.1